MPLETCVGPEKHIDESYQLKEHGFHLGESFLSSRIAGALDRVNEGRNPEKDDRILLESGLEIIESFKKYFISYENSLRGDERTFPDMDYRILNSVDFIFSQVGYYKFRKMSEEELKVLGRRYEELSRDIKMYEILIKSALEQRRDDFTEKVIKFFDSYAIYHAGLC